MDATTWHTCDLPSPVCEALGKWTPLLQHAAWACFYDIPCAPIKQLCRRLGITDVASPSLYDHCVALITHVLPGLSEAELTKVLSQRLFSRKYTCAEFFSDDRIAELFEDDHKGLDEFIEQAKTVKAETETYYESYKVRVAKPKSSYPRPPGVHPKKEKPREVKWLCDLTLELARSLMPWSALVYRDLPNNRWIAYSHANGRKMFGRSWALYGSKEALRLVAKEMWAWHTRATGEPCHLEGL